MKLTPKEMEEFTKFLKANKVNSKPGNLFNIKDAEAIVSLYDKFKNERAIKGGFPAKLAKLDNGGEISVGLIELERNGQKGEPYNVRIENDRKNYDHNNTWSGDAVGKAPDVYKFLIKECKIDADEAFDMIKMALEYT